MIDESLDDDGVALIVWNCQDAAVNVKDARSMAAFVDAADRAIANPAVRGIVIASAKRDFLAGGDLEAVYTVRSAQQAIDQVRGVRDALRRLETCGKPVAAALNGSALGGGLEVALACHHRVAADLPGLRLGLPEVSLGLIPGAGGTQRLPRLIGIAPAARLMLESRSVGPAEALALGLVDAVVPADDVRAAARAWVLAHPQAQQPWDRKGFRFPDFEPQSREGRWFFFNSWPQLRRRTPPGDLAPGVLLQVMAQGLEREIDAGLDIEATHFGLVACSPSAKNRIRTQFIAANAARKLKRRPADVPDFAPRRAGVVGAGLMGSGIALVCARAGLETVVLDTTEAAAVAGKARIAKTLDGQVAQGRLSPDQRDAVLARLQPAADPSALAGCDVVIEAVVESAEVKRRVFRQVTEVCGPAVLLATNTSTLSIDELASGLARADRFIGLHFFAPVDRMALVEVILGRQSSAQAHAHALDLLKRLGKTAIVVNDGPGFFTSRVVGAYTREALHLLAEGVSPALVDNAAIAAGLPIGPLAMADLTSYDLLVDIIASLAAHGRGTACDSAMALDAAQRLVRAGRLGRKGAGGVYDHADGGRQLWPGLSALFPLRAEQPSVDEVTRRLLHVQSLEAVHAMDEGIAEDALEIDLASVLGWSYPAWRGGVLAHIDDIGPASFVAECDVLAERCGQRFRPTASLRRRAALNETFHRR